MYKDLLLVTIDEKNYLLCDEIVGEYCIYSINGELHVGKYVDTYDLICDWIKGIYADHDNIGMFYNGTQNNGKFHIIEPFHKEHYDLIMNEKGKCRAELFQNNINEYLPITINNLIVLHRA